MSWVRELLGRPVLRDVALTAAWFVVLGVVGALVWWQVTPLAEFSRQGTSAQMDEAQLGRQVNSDGWFFVLAAAGGLVSGVALLAWRRRDSLVMVVLVTAGGFLATWVMVRVGLWLGPPNPASVLPHVQDGAKVPIQLKVHATGLYFIWPVMTLVGALGVLWGTDDRPHEAANQEWGSAQSG
jgi:hypothetical protein